MLRRLLCSTAACLPLAACSPAAPERPDLILIVIDALRADVLETWGSPRPNAPHLAELARAGVVFERVVAPSSWTKTSMASILTGTGVFNQYRTVLIVSVAIMALGTIGTFPRLRRNPLVGLSHYLCLVQLAAAVGFVRGLAGRQSVLWRRFDRAHASHSET